MPNTVSEQLSEYSRLSGLPIREFSERVFCAGSTVGEAFYDGWTEPRVRAFETRRVTVKQVFFDCEYDYWDEFSCSALESGVLTFQQVLSIRWNKYLVSRLEANVPYAVIQREYVSTDFLPNGTMPFDLRDDRVPESAGAPPFAGAGADPDPSLLPLYRLANERRIMLDGIHIAAFRAGAEPWQALLFDNFHQVRALEVRVEPFLALECSTEEALIVLLAELRRAAASDVPALSEDPGLYAAGVGDVLPGGSAEYSDEDGGV